MCTVGRISLGADVIASGTTADGAVEVDDGRVVDTSAHSDSSRAEEEARKSSTI